jgi:exopolysaccharide biosynthesis protein
MYIQDKTFDKLLMFQNCYTSVQSAWFKKYSKNENSSADTEMGVHVTKSVPLTFIVKTKGSRQHIPI